MADLYAAAKSGARIFAAHFELRHAHRQRGAIRGVLELVGERVVAAIPTEAPPFRATSGDLPVLPRIRLELGAEPDTVVGAAPSIGASAVGRAGRGTRGGQRFRRGSRAADDGGGGDQFQAVRRERVWFIVSKKTVRGRRTS